MIIMAVDNSLSMVLQLSESLQKAFPKATVASFTDPHKAVTYGYEQKVDAVFSYVAIGGMDVLTLSEHVRMKNKDVKLYIVAEQKVLDEAIQWEEISGFIPRPISVNMLREIAV